MENPKSRKFLSDALYEKRSEKWRTIKASMKLINSRVWNPNPKMKYVWKKENINHKDKYMDTETH